MKKGLKRIGYFILTMFLLLNIIIAFHAYKFTHFFIRNEAVANKETNASTFSAVSSILFGIDSYKLPIKYQPNHAYQTFTITLKMAYR